MRFRYLSAVAAALASSLLAFAQSPSTLSPYHCIPVAASASPDGAAAAGTSAAGDGVAQAADAANPSVCLPDVSGGRQDHGPRVWASAEYLLWWLKGDRVPPLVTTGPAAFPVGFLGNPGTQVLFGGSSLDQGPYSGGRFTAGAWLGKCERIGVEGDYFFLGERDHNAFFSSNTFPVLTRPFINANTGTQFSEFAAFPGISTGTISVTAPTEMWGAGIRLGLPLGCCESRSIVLVGGFQFLQLRESLTVTETATFAPGGPFPTLAGRSFLVTDRFATRNDFYGGQLGVDAKISRGKWILNLRSLVSLGTTFQVVSIQGSQRVTDAAGTVTNFQGGLLALPGANIGRVTHNDFSVVPQVNVNLGYRITEHVSLFAGYNFLYWNNVVRPGEQIDPVIDVTRIPNFVTNAAPLAAVHPVNPFRRTDFWAHGLDAGVALNW